MQEYTSINSLEYSALATYNKQSLSALIDEEEMTKFLRENDDILCAINVKISIVWSHQY